MSKARKHSDRSTEEKRFPGNCRGFLCFAIGGAEGREASAHKEECGHAGGLVMQTKLTNQMVVKIIINTRCWREGG